MYFTGGLQKNYIFDTLKTGEIIEIDSIMFVTALFSQNKPIKREMVLFKGDWLIYIAR